MVETNGGKRICYRITWFISCIGCKKEFTIIDSVPVEILHEADNRNTYRSGECPNCGRKQVIRRKVGHIRRLVAAASTPPVIPQCGES